MKKGRKLLSFILAVITTICISLNLMFGTGVFFGNDFKWILILIVMYILINNALENYDKRLYICSAIFGLITSICAITGYTAEKYLVDNILITKKDVILILCQLEAMFMCITAITIIIFSKLPIFISKIKKQKDIYFICGFSILYCIFTIFIILLSGKCINRFNSTNNAGIRFVGIYYTSSTNSYRINCDMCKIRTFVNRKL